MKVILIIQKNGAITKRYFGVRDLYKVNAVPLITVDSEEEANSLLTRFTKLGYDNKTRLLEGFNGTLEAVEEWGEIFQAFLDTGEVPGIGYDRAMTDPESER